MRSLNPSATSVGGSEHTLILIPYAPFARRIAAVGTPRMREPVLADARGKGPQAQLPNNLDSQFTFGLAISAGEAGYRYTFVSSPGPVHPRRMGQRSPSVQVWGSEGHGSRVRASGHIYING